jgi:hypothetical protein
LLTGLAKILEQNQKNELISGQQKQAEGLFNQGTNVTTDLLNKPMTPVNTMPFNYQQAGEMSVSNPFAEQALKRVMSGWQPLTDGQDKFNPITGETKTNPKAPKVTIPKKIGQATVNGRLVATMSDGTKVDLGESFEGTRLGLAKQNLELSRQRIGAFKDEKLKSEGKYLLDKWNDTEKQYNKNALYLSDPNLAESTRQAILAEQDGLAEKMMGYTASIEALGTTVNDVVAQPKPAPKPKTGEPKQKAVKRTGTTKDGRKVIEYTDGTIEYK